MSLRGEYATYKCGQAVRKGICYPDLRDRTLRERKELLFVGIARDAAADHFNVYGDPVQSVTDLMARGPGKVAHQPQNVGRGLVEVLSHSDPHHRAPLPPRPDPDAVVACAVRQA
jgi:hypothetical protein